jgi:hypothetical protein
LRRKATRKTNGEAEHPEAKRGIPFAEARHSCFRLPEKSGDRFGSAPYRNQRRFGHRLKGILKFEWACQDIWRGGDCCGHSPANLTRQTTLENPNRRAKGKSSERRDNGKERSSSDKAENEESRCNNRNRSTKERQRHIEPQRPTLSRKFLKLTRGFPRPPLENEAVF